MYYVVQYKPPTAGEDFWIGGNKTKHDMLSQAHRRAAVSDLVDFHRLIDDDADINK